MSLCKCRNFHPKTEIRKSSSSASLQIIYLYHIVFPAFNVLELIGLDQQLYTLFYRQPAKSDLKPTGSQTDLLNEIYD